jgi:serine/threonine-protein kinase
MPNALDLEFLALQEALIGRYSLEREIGRGGMGIVYLAHEVRLDRPVALKLLPPDYAAQPALRERFLREARTVAKLSHPNIVPIHAVDEVDDFVFIVMAYVEGGTLGQRIRERGPLPAAEATRILCEVSWALAYAHSQGVVHRDVKPDNILLEAGSGRALVTDFGIAQVSEGPGLTGVGEVLGTAEFISPEQASGEAVDERSDMYSLGVVGHYVVSGRLPFEAPTVSAMLAKHITQAAPPLSSVAPETPRHLAEAIDRCLGKDPDQRFPNGEALAEALSRSLEVRREVPVALRVFVKQNRERFRGLMWFSGVVFYSLFIPFVLWLEEGEPLFALIFTVAWALLAAAPGGMLVSMARRLLRSGYGYDELVLAFKNDIELRREELAFEFGGKQTWVDRLATGLAYGGLAVCGAATASLFFVDLSVAGVVETIFAIGGGGGPWASARRWSHQTDLRIAVDCRENGG